MKPKAGLHPFHLNAYDGRMQSENLKQVFFILGPAFLVYVILVLIRSAIAPSQKSWRSIVSTLKNILLPTTVIFFLLQDVFKMHLDAVAIRLVLTLLGLEAIWIAGNLVQAAIERRSQLPEWRARVPGLYIDLTRLGIILFGGVFVISVVWQRDVSGFIATLGIGTIVLGLALQETLGNMVAGIALVFERPFSVGEWIKVGDTIGEVIEINWRGVRILTRGLDMVIVPNSSLARERIHNFSKPTQVHGVELEVGFSYNDPPNKVKRVLSKSMLATSGVQQDYRNVVRTLGYKDFYINYQVRFFIDDYARLPDIQEEFITRVWYAAKRNKLTIPFPITTVYKSELPAFKAEESTAGLDQALKAVPIFSNLSSEELDTLLREALVQHFAAGERIVHEQEEGDSLYIVKDGRAKVTVRDNAGMEKDVTIFAKGDFFGEMAVLTGEPRQASVTALEDMEVFVIYKDALKLLFEKRPALAEEVATIVEMRRQGLQTIKSVAELGIDKKQEVLGKSKALLARIKSFLKI